MSNVNLSETAPTQFQDIGGVSLTYRHFGKEGAPPVVSAAAANSSTGADDGTIQHRLPAETVEEYALRTERSNEGPRANRKGQQ